MQRRRRLKDGVAKGLRVIRVLAVLMQVFVIGLMLGMLGVCYYHNAFGWQEVGWQLIGLMLYLFWYWVHAQVNALLQYE